MNRKIVAKELVEISKLLIGKKGEVPEAFKKEWKNKDKDNDGKENEPKPDFLKKKEKKSSERVRLTARTKKAADWPYATLVFGKTDVSFSVTTSVPGVRGPMRFTGAEPYRTNVPKAIARVFKVLKMHKVSDQNIEVIA